MKIRKHKVLKRQKPNEQFGGFLECIQQLEKINEQLEKELGEILKRNNGDSKHD